MLSGNFGRNTRIISMRGKEKVLVNFIGCLWVTCPSATIILVERLQCSDWLGVNYIFYSWQQAGFHPRIQDWELARIEVGVGANLFYWQNWGPLVA